VTDQRSEGSPLDGTAADAGRAEDVAPGPTPAPRGRDILVYLDIGAVEQARAVAGDDVVVEPMVERAIARGRLSRTPRPGEPGLRDGERLARPFDVSWVAVVRRHGGRQRRRSRSCWRIVRLVPAPMDAEGDA
jgi:hypothetical protein